MLNIYNKKCKEFNFKDFKCKTPKLNKKEWYIETDNGLKNIQLYQYSMLCNLYGIFNVGRDPKFDGCNQSGVIYGNWKLHHSLNESNDMNHDCNIFMVYSIETNEYLFYHINLHTNKIRKLVKKEFTINKKSLRYTPY